MLSRTGRRTGGGGSRPSDRRSPRQALDRELVGHLTGYWITTKARPCAASIGDPVGRSSAAEAGQDRARSRPSAVESELGGRNASLVRGQPLTARGTAPVRLQAPSLRRRLTGRSVTDHGQLARGRPSSLRPHTRALFPSG